MDFNAIQNQLLDVPQTFKRLGDPYTNFIDALTSALFLYTQATDGLFAQTNFNLSANGWVDVWGSLAGIPRRVNEADLIYRNRIRHMILAFHATPIAIRDWLGIVEQVQGSVTELLPTVGYQITVPPSLQLPQIQQIITDLAYVRPAGVPFVFVQEAGNTYLNTVNYLGAARVTGAYLAGNVLSLNALIPAFTINAVGLLPDLLFTDPLINPNLPPVPPVTVPQPSILATNQLFVVQCNGGALTTGSTVLATWEGSTAHTSWYYDSAVFASNIPTVQANLDLCIGAVETAYATLLTYFNVTAPASGQTQATAQDPSGLKFNFIATTPGGNPGSAFHCINGFFGNIYISEDTALSAKALMFGGLAELVECFEYQYNTGVTEPWGPNTFIGEALSVVLAEELLNAGTFGIDYTGWSQVWLNNNDPNESNANRFNYGSTTATVGSDTNQFAVGFGVLVIYWLRYHKSKTYAQIVQNGALTFAGLCTALSLSITTFMTDIQSLLPSGSPYNLVTLYPTHPDNPWM